MPKICLFHIGSGEVRHSSVPSSLWHQVPATPAVPTSFARKIPYRDSSVPEAIIPVIPTSGVGPSHIYLDAPPRCALPKPQNNEQQSWFSSSSRRQFIVRIISAGGRRTYPSNCLVGFLRWIVLAIPTSSCNVGCIPSGRVACVDCPHAEFPNSSGKR